MPEEAPTQACYGLDIGAMSLVAARDDGELLRNECSDTSTKSIVSFSGKQRHLGEAAANSLSTNGRNTATAVGRLALMPHARLAASPQAAHWQFTHSARDGGGFEMEAQSLRDSMAASTKEMNEAKATLAAASETQATSEGDLSVAIESLTETTTNLKTQSAGCETAVEEIGRAHV